MFESRKGRSDLPKVVKLPNMTAEVARLSSVDNVRYQTATGNAKGADDVSIDPGHYISFTKRLT
jgi:hypothetical protein